MLGSLRRRSRRSSRFTKRSTARRHFRARPILLKRVLRAVSTGRGDGALPVVGPAGQAGVSGPGRGFLVATVSCRPAVGVKVERPTGRTTLTPARAGAQSRYEGVALAAQFTGVTS